MDPENSVKGIVSVNRKTEDKKNTLDDIIFMLIGDATAANIIMIIFAVGFFSAVPIAMLMVFGTYSGGMRWLISLGLIAAMAVVAIFLMKRGVAHQAENSAKVLAKTSYPGELTGLTEAFERAWAGYVYSQQIIRERLSDITIDKVALARDMGREEIVERLESSKGSVIEDVILSKFVRLNRRGAQKWEDSRTHGKGKSKERGEKFMLEIDDILSRMEALI